MKKKSSNELQSRLQKLAGVLTESNASTRAPVVLDDNQLKQVLGAGSSSSSYCTSRPC